MNTLANRPSRSALLACALGLAAALPALAAADLGHAPAASAASATPAAATKAPPAAKTARAPAAPASAAPAAAVPAAPAAVATAADPLAALRDKLARRLGGTLAPDAQGGAIVRVPARAPAAHGESALKPVAHAKPDDMAHGATAKPATRRAAPAPGHAVHWSYSGDGGPQAWGAMKPEFAKCSTGMRQSPIDIRGGIGVELEPIAFDYRASAFAVIDNGHTVQVNVGAGNSIEILGRRYELLQFHFHRPSEEHVDGRQFDMVAHLVHKDLEGRLAVVAVLLDRGSAQPLIQTVWNNLPLEKGEELPARARIDLNHLLPQDRRYYTYMGSLTTPPCSEGVLWMVMQQPVAISPEQIDIFARLYPMNARSLQSAAGRLIKRSN